jgi:hypothetical protein
MLPKEGRVWSSGNPEGARKQMLAVSSASGSESWRTIKRAFERSRDPAKSVSP